MSMILSLEAEVLEGCLECPDRVSMFDSGLCSDLEGQGGSRLLVDEHDVCSMFILVASCLTCRIRRDTALSMLYA